MRDSRKLPLSAYYLEIPAITNWRLICQENHFQGITTFNDVNKDIS